MDFYCSPGTRRSPDWYWLDGRFRPYIVGTPLQTSVVPTHWRPRPLPPTSTPEDKLIRDLDRAPASLSAERDQNKRLVEAGRTLTGWREHDYPEHFDRWTAQYLSDRYRAALARHNREGDER